MEQIVNAASSTASTHLSIPSGLVQYQITVLFVDDQVIIDEAVRGLLADEIS